ncbi:MAG: nucleotidyltransferase [Angelakisella sp.]
MNKPILVVMAAGMGSRYGGLKQIDPVGAHGEIIIDFSLYDAYKAGFRRVVFIIKKAIEADFREIIGDRMAKLMEVQYAYQEVEDIPAGFTVPEGRNKPWGTGHAVLACRGLIDAPFAVINADDYYGAQAFQVIFDRLCCTADDYQYRYCMVGYRLENTLTDHGHVARGICIVAPNHTLSDIHERVHIEKREGGAQYTEDEGKSWVTIPPDSTASMNLWGFTPSLIEELGSRFPAFLEKALKENPLKAEFFLPTVVNDLLREQKATVHVLNSPDRWYGVTYREDKPVVEAAIAKLRADGVYPEYLWEGMQDE